MRKALTILTLIATTAIATAQTEAGKAALDRRIRGAEAARNAPHNSIPDDRGSRPKHWTDEPEAGDFNFEGAGMVGGRGHFLAAERRAARAAKYHAAREPQAIGPQLPILDADFYARACAKRSAAQGSFATTYEPTEHPFVSRYRDRRYRHAVGPFELDSPELAELAKRYDTKLRQALSTHAQALARQTDELGHAGNLRARVKNTRAQLDEVAARVFLDVESFDLAGWEAWALKIQREERKAEADAAAARKRRGPIVERLGFGFHRGGRRR